MTIQLKVTEQYFPVMLFIILHKVVITFESVDVTIQMKATEQYFSVVLFIMLHKVVLTLESAEEILKCDHSITCTKMTFWTSIFNYIWMLSEEKG